jgi:hypothetical protein
MQTRYGQPSNLLLWFAILAAPAAWSAHLSVEYFLTTAECQLSAGDMGPLMAATTAGLFALAFAGLYAGVVALRRTSGATHTEDTELRRRHFMARSGVLLSILFIAGLVMATIPLIFLEPCNVGP